MPLPRLPPAVSPWPRVLVTAPSEHGTGKGAGRVPVGPALPHTCRVTEPQLVTHGCSLPTPGTGVGTRHPHSPRPHTGLSAQGALTPLKKGQPAPQGERRDTHPAEREPRRRQESPEGESPGAEPPWRRRARPALTSGGDGGLRRPWGSPAQLGPAGGELLQRENGKGGKSHCVPQCYSAGTPAPNHPSRTQGRGVGPCHGCTVSGLDCGGKEAKRLQLPFRKVFGPLGASFSHSGSQQPPPSSP